MAYASQADLQARLGSSVMRAVFDDANTGSPDSTIIASLLTLASARVDSYIARSYKGPLPVPPNAITGLVPSLLVQATVEWARAFAFERHPEYGDAAVEGANKLAHQVSERIADGANFLVDNSGQPVPGTSGGVVFTSTNHITLPNADGTSGAGDF